MVYRKKGPYSFKRNVLVRYLKINVGMIIKFFITSEAKLFKQMRRERGHVDLVCETRQRRHSVYRSWLRQVIWTCCRRSSKQITELVLWNFYSTFTMYSTHRFLLLYTIFLLAQRNSSGFALIGSNFFQSCQIKRSYTRLDQVNTAVGPRDFFLGQNKFDPRWSWSKIQD